MSDALVIGPDRTGQTIAIDDGRVVNAAPDGAAVLACPDGVIAPGAVNAHTHLYSGLAPLGMPAPAAQPENFLQILERVWWKLDRALDAETLAAAAEYSVARALLAGTTALIDHHESPNLIEGSLGILAGACESLGIRALLCYGATERNDGLSEAARGLDECAYLTSSDLIRTAVGLHASFTVSDETIRAAGAMARRLGTVVHVHVAEDRADVADAVARGHAGPLERLETLGALVPGSILAHGVHLSADQVRRAEELGCWLVHNPRSNEGNRVGYAGALGAASAVALGTDGWVADMAEEEAARARLAAANGDASGSGRLAAGRRLIEERFSGPVADFVVRDGGAVRHVVVGGRVAVRDGRLTNGDAQEIEAKALLAAERLWTRMAAM